VKDHIFKLFIAHSGPHSANLTGFIFKDSELNSARVKYPANFTFDGGWIS